MAEQEKKDNILYIFIDESGDFTFSNKGSKFFILTAASTIHPLNRRDLPLSARYELLCEGYNIEYFHATVDAQVVRNKFYEKIKDLPDYEIDSVIAEKRKANFTLYEEVMAESSKTGFLKIKTEQVHEKFYKQLCETLLKYVCHRYLKIRASLGIKKVVVVLDQALPNKKREFVTKSIKQYIKSHFGLVPYMYFHSTKSDVNCQIADYCCWAMKKKWTDNELRPYNEIKHNVKSEFDIFRNGEKYFY
ncbi:MAG: DUF3800 domain-containing protein [Candidatus Nomurabacteria bacterium]|nr:DUF3800 domain-containing protein [Candidatus Nomurabacteria bacterium]USN87422.1 MAG: DUF3800 domain-containing protein [Candidatus Nomurabacteria bacterium]